MILDTGNINNRQSEPLLYIHIYTYIYIYIYILTNINLNMNCLEHHVPRIRLFGTRPYASKIIFDWSISYFLWSREITIAPIVPDYKNLCLKLVKMTVCVLNLRKTVFIYKTFYRMKTRLSQFTGKGGKLNAVVIAAITRLYICIYIAPIR